MSAIITSKFRFAQAASFISSFATNNIYIAIGKSSTWTSSDGVGANENLPAVPSDSATQDTKDFNQMLGMKLVPAAGVSYVIPRQDWQTGTVYTMYDDADATLNTTGHLCYVLNPNTYGLYKCIWNNSGSVSTVLPAGNGTSVFTTADNYQWKYMFTLLPNDVTTFLNSAWIPIRDRNNAVLATDQAAVQTSTAAGAIHTIKIATAGSGYTNGTYAISGSNIVGDGTGFVGSVTVVGGALSSVTVSSIGSGYSYATITIPTGAGAGTSGSIRAIISPPSGHGYDSVVELNAFYVIATTTLNYGENLEISTSNDYRKIFLLQNPLLQAGTSQAVPGASVKNNNTKLTYTGATSGTFQLDEIVNFGSSASQGLLVDHDITNKTLYFTELSGTTIPATATATGTTSGATVTYAAVAPPYFKTKTGYIIYKDYRKAIMRSFDQTETISTVVSF